MTDETQTRREYQRHVNLEMIESLIKKTKEWTLYHQGLMTDFGTDIVSFPCMQTSIDGLEIKLESNYKRRNPTVDCKIPVIGFGTKYSLLVNENGVAVYSDSSNFAKKMFKLVHRGEWGIRK